MQKNPLVSVIIPTKNSARTLEKYLRSIQNQTYHNIEIIVVIPKKNPIFEKLVHKYHYTLIYCSEGKSAARNSGAHVANGEYLLHVDDDMRLSDNVVSECIDVVLNKGFKAVAIPEFEEETKNFYGKIRFLEKVIVYSDKNIEAPRFIKKSIFNELGGFNVELDPIDEGDLKVKLEESGIRHATIKACITLSSDGRLSNLRSRWSDMYIRGQKTVLFNALHPKSHQFKPLKRIRAYTKEKNELLKQPIVASGLIFVKLLDLIVLKCGAYRASKKDLQSVAAIRNKIIFENESNTYQMEFYENTIGGSYVDEQEKKSVLDAFKILPKEASLNILDIGAGGGRWSELMLEYFPNANITALDLSKGMIKNLQQGLGSHYPTRFKAVLSDMSELPFKNAQFDLVFSFRAIKYSQNQPKVLLEVRRVLKNEGFSVIEFPYANIIYRLLKGLNLLTSEYLKRIKVYSKNDLYHMLIDAKLEVQSRTILFTTPATLYKKISRKWLLTIINLINGVLPKNYFGRSIIIISKYKR